MGSIARKLVGKSKVRERSELIIDTGEFAKRNYRTADRRNQVGIKEQEGKRDRK